MIIKPYQLLNEKIVNKGKGMSNNTFTRFIGPGDSVFSLFMRSCCSKSLEDAESNSYEFVIYDKNPKNIEMFKYVLNWGCPEKEDNSPWYWTAEDFKNFQDYVESPLAPRRLDSFTFDTFYLLEEMSFKSFDNKSYDFRKAWNIFKKSKFIFLEIDAVKDNKEFISYLYNELDLLEIGKRQFLKLDFNKNNYDQEEYIESINNILHLFWMRSLKDYTTVVELYDTEENSKEDFASKLYAKANPTFCILPWMHVQYKPSGQSKLCCRYDNLKEIKDFEESEKTSIPNENLSHLYKEKENLVIQKFSMEESFNSNYWNTARQYTIENKPISGCQKCYNEEQSSGEFVMSMRLGSSILYNQGYLHKKPDHKIPKIKFLEVGFGNYCNLACLSCNSTLSTTWHDDEVKLNSMSDKSLQRLIFPKLDNIRFEPNEKTLKTLELIKFTGGEPMINPEFIKFIDLVCEKGTPEKISLEIYTNCSYIPSPKLLTNLIRFKEVQLNLSIDAYGSVNDYVRYGSQWHGDGKQTVNNAMNFWLEQGKNNKNIRVIMSTTLSILNVFDVPELMENWVEKYKNSGNSIIVNMYSNYDGFFKLQLAVDPSYINMNILPAEYYSEILAWCEEYGKSFTTKYPEFQGVPESINASLIKLTNTINRCKGNPTNASLLVEYLNKMDSIRGNSASKSIPVMLNKVKEYLLTQDTLQQN